MGLAQRPTSSAPPLKIGAKQRRVLWSDRFPKEPALEMTVLPFPAFDQKHALTADVGMVTALGNIEAIQNATKRIAEPRSIGDLECHELIPQTVDRIALEELLAFIRDTQRNRAPILCRWLANHQSLALKRGGDLRCSTASRAQKAGECSRRPRKPVCTGKKAQGHPFPIAQTRKVALEEPAVSRLYQEL